MTTPSDFEKALCKRICDICNTSIIPTTEKSIQSALITNDWKIKEALKEHSIPVRILENWPTKTTPPPPPPHPTWKATAECQYDEFKYQATGVHASVLTANSAVECFIRRYKYGYEDTIYLHADISYEKEGEIKNYVELKYPKIFTTKHIDARWDYLQNRCSDFESSRPFVAPFLRMEKPEQLILTDCQEGSMFVDFIRLMNAKDCNRYFVAFFRRSDFCSYNRAEFELRINILIQYYLNTSDKILYALTRGKRDINDEQVNNYIDIWKNKKPGKIMYFCKYDHDFEFHEFSGSFNILSEGDKLVAFLLKLVPETRTRV